MFFIYHFIGLFAGGKTSPFAYSFVFPDIFLIKFQVMSVLVVNQPLYDLTKKMQWTFPNIFGEDKFVVMLGGLHIETALWNTTGDLLRLSGWPETLKKIWASEDRSSSHRFSESIQCNENKICPSSYCNGTRQSFEESLRRQWNRDSC